MSEGYPEGILAPLGYMAQLGHIIYQFSALARLPDGALRDFSVEITTPEECGEWEWVCQLSCSFLRDKPFEIRGVDGVQALQLARRFVEQMLEGEAQLVDSEGRKVDLPPLPGTES